MRLLGNTSGSALFVVAIAAIVAACGSNAGDNGFNVSDGGRSGSSSGSGGDSGVGTFGDGGNSGGNDTGTVLPPKGCDSSCGAAGGQCLNDRCVIVDNAAGRLLG
jgi:hypothetical protein